jgi:hypothetical protein
VNFEDATIILVGNWIILSLCIGAWAARWDRSAIVWSLLSFIGSPFLIVACLLMLGEGGKTCHLCAETVKFAAGRCKHCGAELLNPPSQIERGPESAFQNFPNRHLVDN